MKNKNMLVGLTVLIVAIIIVNIFVFIPKQGEEIIEIGFIGILSGVGANEGITTKQGVDLAVKEINNAEGINGKKIKINYQDTPNDDKKTAVSSFYQLNNNGVEIIIGTTWSGSALAVAPIACNNNVLMIAPAIGIKEFEQECDYIFNIWMADEDVSRLLGKKIYNNGHRKLAIIGSQQAWEIVQARSVKESFIESGGEVVVYELPSAEQKDFKTEILKVKEAKPDAIFIQYIYQDIISKQLKQADVNIPIYAELVDTTRIENANGALEGTIATSQVSPTTDFIEKFKKEYNQVPDFGADNGYDIVKLIAKAIEETDSTNPEILKEYLKTVEYYDGASGYLTFTEDGGVTKEISFIKIDNGNIVALDN